MPPGAVGGAEGLDPSCSELHENQEITPSNLAPPLTLFERCHRHLKVSTIEIGTNKKQIYIYIHILL